MDPMDQKQHSAEVEDIGPKTVNLQSGVDGYVPGTDEEKRLVRKIDLYLLPTIWIMYLLSYVDRTKLVLSLIILHTWIQVVLTASAQYRQCKSSRHGYGSRTRF